MSGINKPPRWLAEGVLNPAWIDWHAEIVAGRRAVCLGCEQSFEFPDLTNAMACSYLCYPCADSIEAEIEAL